MSSKERDRLIVLNRVVQGEITLREGSLELDLSYRQTKRLKSQYVQYGAVGLVHQSRGCPSNRALPSTLKHQVLCLYEEHYSDYGPTLASEVLSEEHDVDVHPETLRRWLHQSHLLSYKTRPRHHRKKRRRREHFGAMLQIDGSHHRWYEHRSNPSCLMVAVDDATGQTMSYMSEQETLQSAFALLYKWITQYGVPESVYVDRKSVYTGDTNYFVRSKKAHERNSGDFIHACRELGIRIIQAYSPQAKGRVERKNGVLQDRLVKELRRKNINTISQTNQMLDQFNVRLDEKFAVAPIKDVDRHRKVPKLNELNKILSRRHKRKVQLDWTISYKGKRYQILKQENMPNPRQQVIVRQCYDGHIEIEYKEKFLKWEKIG